MNPVRQSLLCIGLSLLGSMTVSCQQVESKKQFLPVCIGFYNVENLFDTIPQSGTFDEDFTPQGSYVWTSERYNEKLDRLSEVISLMGQEMSPDGPAILGLAEIENDDVVKDLVQHDRISDRNYEVIFRQGRDKRISNAMIYNPKYFDVGHIVSKPVLPGALEDFDTRDHLIVSGKLLGESITVIVAHWPSRSGGESRSRPRRIAAAQSAREAIDSLKAADPDVQIIFMGDLNDDPIDDSVDDYLNAEGDLDDLDPGELYNPYVDFARKGVGSLAYRDAWNLFDQIIISQTLLEDDFDTFGFYEAEVFNKPFLRQQEGRFQGYPFRTRAGGVHLGGYSDHFPVYIFLIRKIK